MLNFALFIFYLVNLAIHCCLQWNGDDISTTLKFNMHIKMCATYPSPEQFLQKKKNSHYTTAQLLVYLEAIENQFCSQR